MKLGKNIYDEARHSVSSRKYSVKSLSILVAAICLSIFSGMMFSSVVFALEENQASANVNWTNQPYYQGSNATVSIYFHNNSTEQLTIYFVGFHFDWMAKDNFTGFNLSNNPINVTANGSYTFNPMLIHIPTNVAVGSHNYTIGIDGYQGTSYPYEEFGWDSPAFSLEIFDFRVKSFNTLLVEVNNKMGEATNATYRSPDARSLLSQAEGEKNDAVALAMAEDWDAALLKLQSASEHLNKAEAKEAAFEETGIPQNLLLVVIGVVITIVVIILLIAFVMRKNGKKPRVESETTAKPAKIGDDIAARLENLKGLLDKDLITEEEYEKRKNEILAQV